MKIRHDRVVPAALKVVLLYSNIYQKQTNKDEEFLLDCTNEPLLL